MDYVSKKEWLRFLELFSLVVAVVSIVAGILFFVAYNWDLLGKFFKFALVEFVLVVAVGIYFFSNNRTISKISIISASFVVGVLLALIGQVYNSNVDSWELFFYWSILIFPWVVLQKDATLWLFEIILVNIALFLYNDINKFFIFYGDSASFMLQFLLNTIAFLVWEIFNKKLNWEANGWERKILALFSAISFVLLSITSSVYIYPVALIYFVVIYLYYYPKKDMDILTIAATTFWFFVIITIFHIVPWRRDWLIGILTLSLVSSSLGAYLISFLKGVNANAE
jgi:uncharacterized membrane protein